MTINYDEGDGDDRGESDDEVMAIRWGWTKKNFLFFFWRLVRAEKTHRWKVRVQEWKKRKTQQADEFFSVKWLERKKLGRPVMVVKQHPLPMLTGWLMLMSRRPNGEWGSEWEGRRREAQCQRSTMWQLSQRAVVVVVVVVGLLVSCWNCCCCWSSWLGWSVGVGEGPNCNIRSMRECICTKVWEGCCCCCWYTKKKERDWKKHWATQSLKPNSLFFSPVFGACPLAFVGSLVVWWRKHCTHTHTSSSRQTTARSSAVCGCVRWLVISYLRDGQNKAERMEEVNQEGERAR